MAAVAGREQAWTAQGWVERFGLPFDPADHGYGHGPDEVAAVRVGSRELLTGYYDAVHAQTLDYVRTLTPPDLDRVVDRSWDPPVTLAVRLVSVLSDDLQHVGQAAFARGILERRAPALTSPRRRDLGDAAPLVRHAWAGTCPWRSWCGASSEPSERAVGVPTMFDPQHDHFSYVLADAVEDAVGAAACRSRFLRQVVAERLAYAAAAARVSVRRDEGDDRRGDRFRQLAFDGTPRWWGSERARTWGSPLTGAAGGRLRHPARCRPRRTPGRLRRMSASASGSLSTSRVSVQLSDVAQVLRSRTLPPAWPLRVTTTRPCWCSTRSTASEQVGRVPTRSDSVRS